jgi:hypothetical protein
LSYQDKKAKKGKKIAAKKEEKIMLIYIYKNNGQFGPFEESKVLEWLAGGQLSYEDLAVRQGGTKWEPLRVLFPAAVNPAVLQPVFSNPAAAVAAPVGAGKPAAKKSGKGFLFVMLGAISLIFVGLVGSAVIFAVNRTPRKSEPVSANRTSPDSSDKKTNPSAASLKDLKDRSKELAKFKAPLQLENKPVLKGKVAIIEQTDTSSEYSINLRGFHSYDDNYDDSEIESYGLTKERLARTPAEIDTLVQTSCAKGKMVGQYSSRFGVINAYSRVCKVSIIDYRSSKIIAQKTFENRKMEKTVPVSEYTYEYVLLYPYKDIQKYVSGLAKQ